VLAQGSEEVLLEVALKLRAIKRAQELFQSSKALFWRAFRPIYEMPPLLGDPGSQNPSMPLFSKGCAYLTKQFQLDVLNCRGKYHTTNFWILQSVRLTCPGRASTVPFFLPWHSWKPQSLSPDAATHP